jgi:hypothetical protein
MEEQPAVSRENPIHPSHVMRSVSDVPSMCIKCRACVCHGISTLGFECEVAKKEIVHLEDLPEDTVIAPGAFKIPSHEVPLVVYSGGVRTVLGTAKVTEGPSGLVVEAHFNKKEEDNG